MPDIYALAQRHRAAVLRRDAQALQEMEAAYHPVREYLHEAIDDLLRRMAEAEARGETIGPAWLFQENRLGKLTDAVEEEIAGFAVESLHSIRQQQQAAVSLGQGHARQLMEEAISGKGVAGVSGPVFTTLPSGAFGDLAGFLGDGTPLHAVLATFGPDAAEATRTALLVGLAAGRGIDATAREIRAAAEVPLTRAQTITRTETLRAYRTTLQRTYSANGSVLQGWIWTATLAARSCPVCIAMHNTTHPLEEPFGSHVNCRCTPRPWVRGEDAPAEEETGTAWFDRQTAQVQRGILGSMKHKAYRAGQITLPDLVGYNEDPAWGPERYEKSLRAIGTT